MNGGDRQSGITDEAGCKNVCLNKTNCVGFDLDLSGCWLQYDSTATTNSRPGTKHYVRVKANCAASKYEVTDKPIVSKLISQ